MKHELSKPIALLKHVVSGMLRVFNLSELHRTERGYKPMYLASGLGLYSMGKRAITANVSSAYAVKKATRIEL